MHVSLGMWIFLSALCSTRFVVISAMHAQLILCTNCWYHYKMFYLKMQLDSFSLPGHVIHPLRWNSAWKRTVGSHFLWLGHGWLCWTQKWQHKFYCRYVTQFAATRKCLILGHFLINIAKYQDNCECTFTSWMTESASAVFIGKTCLWLSRTWNVN